MKIKISYEPDENMKALKLIGLIQDYLPEITIHKSQRHPPYLHIYLATKKPGKSDNKAENN